MSEFDPSAYGPAIEVLLHRAPLNPLDAGRPDTTVRAKLAALTDESVRPLSRHNMAAACRAGLWLRFNFLEESHKISQEIDTPEGSFWHGILHRREGDFDNAKYWLRRVGKHPVFAPLADAAANLAAAAGSAPVMQGGWDPFAFVDRCAASGAGSARLLEEIQLQEWELLFDYCWRHALDG